MNGTPYKLNTSEDEMLGWDEGRPFFSSFPNSTEQGTRYLTQPGVGIISRPVRRPKMNSFPPETVLPHPDYPGVFVFGSNAFGRHGSGAARHAHLVYGYPEGKSDCLIGDAYGIATKVHWWDRIGSLLLIEKNVPLLAATMQDNPDLMFNITAIGTGYANLTFADVAPLLSPLVLPNARFDARWLLYLP